MNDTNSNKIFNLWMVQLKSDNTRIAYRKAFVDLQKVVNKQLLQVSPEDVQSWIDVMTARQLSNKTVCMYSAAVSSFFAYAKRMGYSVENPAKDADKPEDKPMEEIFWFNMDDLKKLFSVIDRTTVIGKRDYALFLSYVLLGRRNSEIRNLQFEDFKMIDNILYYVWSGKGKENERAICPPEVIRAVADYLKAAGRNSAKPTDYIFTRTNAGVNDVPLSISVVDVILKQYVEKAGLPTDRVHIHCLRHTAVMLRLDAGESVENISKFLGHSSISITQNNYVHEVEAK
jgi:integrase